MYSNVALLAYMLIEMSQYAHNSNGHKNHLNWFYFHHTVLMQINFFNAGK